MKKITPVFIIGLLAILGCSSVALADSYKDKNINPLNILTWLRSSSPDFGCMMEKEFGARNVKYNCSTKHVPEGDPCKNTKDYYAGPEFPEKLISRIGPFVDGVYLTWEHAELQDVMISFEKHMTKEEIENALKIKLDPKPENVMDISIQECSKRGSCLSVQGFQHLGSGDVNCEENVHP